MLGVFIDSAIFGREFQTLSFIFRTKCAVICHPFYLEKCFTQVVEFIFPDRIFLKSNSSICRFSKSNQCKQPDLEK